MNRLEPEKKGMLQMACCASLWSLAGIFIKLIPWNPMVIAGGRSLFSFFTVLVFLKVTKTPFVINKRTFLNGFLLCAIFLCFIGANKLTTAANAIVLQFTAPVFILLISVLFLHQKFRRADVVAVFFTLGGIALFFFDQLAPGYLLGNFVAILAGLIFAGVLISTGTATDEEKMGGQLLGHLMTAAVGLPFLLFVDTPISGRSVVLVVLLGVVQLGIPYLLMAFASRTCSPLSCSLIGALEPLLNPVWVAVFYGEMPGTFALIGGVIVIGAVTIWTVWKEKHPLEQ